MGKKQHQKDKLYLTTTEWKDLYGGNKHKIRADNATSGTYVRLPFYHCSITFEPIENFCCTVDGAIYEKKNIVNFISKYNCHPITGNKLKLEDVIDLHFHTNEEKKYWCPITYREFNDHSHIVAIRTSGNVYSWDAVHHLNFKCERFVDLLTEVPFDGKADVIKLQDPLNVDRMNISKFYHVRCSLKTNDEDISKPEFYLNNLNNDAISTLKKISETKSEFVVPQVLKQSKTIPTKIQSSNVSTGALAASLTSTAMDPEIHLIPKEQSVHSLVWSRLQAKPCKAYTSILTNIGRLNLELFASITPKTVHNFLLLCRQNYYNNCEFFRSIKHFIVQTGDPTNTGYGGQSAWPKEPKFEDEFPSKQLKHDKRGVLSMANSGPNSNGSQFFITYRSCNQLNRKHTIFGQLVGGFETLSKIEAIEVDDKDKPKERIFIKCVDIYEDPSIKFENEIEEELKAEKLKELQKLQQQNKITDKAKIASKRIGKYLDVKRSIDTIDPTTNEYEIKKRQKRLNTNLIDNSDKFSNWII